MYPEGKLEFSLHCIQLYVSFLSFFAYRRYRTKKKSNRDTYDELRILFKVIFYMKGNCLANGTMQNLV